MKRLILLTILLLFSVVSFSQNQTIQERLGYSKDARLVIIHADDLGVSHSENMASIEALEKGVVSSGSIMVPCPWFPEIANYSVKNPDTDLGLHLTLNSEWNYYKWSAVSPAGEVPTLLDSMGYLYATTEGVVNNASPKEVEVELRNQIERAKAFGVDPTHFDAHMGTAFSNPEFAEIYIKLGREYKVPVLLHGRMLKMFYGVDSENLITENDIQVDNVVAASPQDFESGMTEFYTNALRNLQPGLTYLIIHTAYDDEEMKAVTIDHPYYGSNWRQQDFDFFTGGEAKKIIEEEGIKVITWREIRDKLVRQ